MPCFHRRTLASGEKVTRVAREWHTRKSGAYVIQDRYRKVTILSQRLSLIASYLNEMAEDRGEKVSVTGLYQIADRGCDNRCSGFTKNRWNVSFCGLEDVAAKFESARGVHEHALILGAPSAYMVLSGEK